MEAYFTAVGALFCAFGSWALFVSALRQEQRGHFMRSPLILGVAILAGAWSLMLFASFANQALVFGK